MQELVSRLSFLVIVNCYLDVASTAHSSPTMNANVNQLNGAHLKFVAAHVNMKIIFTFVFYNYVFLNRHNFIII